MQDLKGKLPNEQPAASDPWLQKPNRIGGVELMPFYFERQDAWAAVLRKVYAPLVSDDLQQRIDAYWDARRLAEKNGEEIPSSKELDAEILKCPHRDTDAHRLAVVFCYLLTLPSIQISRALADVDALFADAGAWRNKIKAPTEKFLETKNEIEAEAVRWQAEVMPQGGDDEIPKA